MPEVDKAVAAAAGDGPGDDGEFEPPKENIAGAGPGDANEGGLPKEKASTEAGIGACGSEFTSKRKDSKCTTSE